MRADKGCDFGQTTSGGKAMPPVALTRLRPWLALGMACAVAACGGGGGDAPAGTVPPVVNPPVVSQAVAQQCSAQNPYRADAQSATTLGSLNVEKEWVRRYMSEAYLWPEQMQTVDAALPAYSQDTALGFDDSISSYFKALRTPQTTASGAKVDRFSFTYSTKKWKALSESGESFDYGISWAYFSSSPPRKWVVAGVQPNSPAALAGVQRGDSLSQVDGVDFAAGSDVAALNAGLLPSTASPHQLGFKRLDGTTAVHTMTAGTTVSDPVPLSKVMTVNGQKVGYLAFHEHIATAEEKLWAASHQFKDAGIQDLVIDLRYNGGGYLYIASELAFVVAGSERTQGKVFEKLVYNSARTADNAKAPHPFYSIGYNNKPFAQLNLSRVYILTSGDTCSASESLINGLRGVGVDVRLIGDTTCGKPYGFTAKDNCGISYFPIEFKGVNAMGFGDFSDGFVPASANLGGSRVPGCAGVPDDFSRALGDPQEGMLNAALTYRATGQCPVPVKAGRVSINALSASPDKGQIALPVAQQVRQNKWLKQP